MTVDEVKRAVVSQMNWVTLSQKAKECVPDS
jgi:hypothetical protein